MSEYKATEIEWNNPVITKLLKDNGLPYTDITDAVIFLCIISDNNITGIVGLEKYNKYALLRSLVVEKNYRNNSIGNMLVDEVISICIKENIKGLYLLTNTADSYFSKKGFRIIQRDKIPEVIKQTSEFTDMCPKTSICMEKNL